MDICRNHLESWLGRHGYANIYVDYSMEFAYDYENHIIYCGLGKTDELDTYFYQYLYEYGCDCTSICIEALSFLHEVGHAVTIPNFSTEEIMLCSFMKDNQNEDDDMFVRAYYYWNMADEIAANMFVIDFVMNNPKAVSELEEIFVADFERVCNDTEAWSYIFEEEEDDEEQCVES